MKKAQIANALVWGIVLLVVTYIFRGDENAKYTFLIFTLGYTASNNLLQKALKSNIDKC